jgi:DNA end-binding protein Ku
MAEQLIAAMTGTFDPTEYRDEYRAALEEVIEAKVEGREIAEPEAPAAGGQLVDLMAMLEASVNAARTAKSNREVEAEAEEEAEAAAETAEAAGGNRRKATGSKPQRAKKAAPAVDDTAEAAPRKVARRKTA